MRMPIAGLIVILIVAAGLRADEPTPAAQLAAIKSAMDAAYKETSASLEKAKTRDEMNQAWKVLNARCAPFLVRAVELAEKYPDDPAAIDALTFVLSSPLAYRDDTAAPIERTYSLLLERYADSDRLTHRCIFATDHYALRSASSVPLLRAILAKNPSRVLRGVACAHLAPQLSSQAFYARALRDPEEAKKLTFLPPSAITYLKEMDPDAAERESDQLLERIIREFGDVRTSSSAATLGESAAGKLFRRRNLVVGKPIPDIEAGDIDGKPLKLSDYRGKVVALVFWASWCAPCMAMVPHERELVKRLEGKPFALVGVNGDETPDAATKATEKERMIWPSFFDGKQGREPLAVKWGVDSWPTVFVIDAQGIIRHTDPDLRGPTLDKAIDGLLAEMDGAKK